MNYEKICDSSPPLVKMMMNEVELTDASLTDAVLVEAILSCTIFTDVNITAISKSQWC